MGNDNASVINKMRVIAFIDGFNLYHALEEFKHGVDEADKGRYRKYKWLCLTSGDEFWYTCVPSDVAVELQSCSNTAFRETEITIDGQPAGVAPVFPWIYTGGIDPFLWFPIPGVQTLNFSPYRVNLTPFAALLSNGQQHTVSLSVYNANNYFSATASLLLYLDAGSTQVTGAITKNTLSGPSPAVTENINTQPFIKGTVDVSSKRSFTITGYANTSKGKVTTSVGQTVNFVNKQNFTINSQEYVQDIYQDTTVSSYTTVSKAGVDNVVYYQGYSFPLKVDISLVNQTNGDIYQTTTAQQTYGLNTSTTQAGKVTYSSSLLNTGMHADTLEFDSGFNFLGNTAQSSTQQYNSYDSTGAGYVCALGASANALNFVSAGCGQ